MYDGEKNEDGEPHGVGTKTYKNGNEYRGQWKNGEHDGHGKMTYANPKVIYEGCWQEGKPHGYGKEMILHGKGTYGDTFEGCWTNGKFIGGQNCKVTKANGMQYEGEMLNKNSHGKGTITHANGDKYTGDFWKGKMNGSGTFVSVNGNKVKYSGEFKNNTFHGQGTLEEDGNIHTGSFASGLPHGQGVLKCANGDVFTGRFWKGRKHGRGKIKTRSGVEYDGAWFKGKANGNGTFKDGQYEYSGSWKGGKKHGKGVAKDKDQIYSGDFVNDDFHGEGELTYSNGDTFVGEFKSGQKYKGLLSFSNGGKYDGQFLNDDLSEGTFFYADEEIYFGQFVSGKSHGYGEHTYRDGSVFKGQWREDMMHGEGKLTKSNGDVYEGAWMNDKKHGYFTYTCTTGEVFKERYENDKRLLSKRLCPGDKDSLPICSKAKEINQFNAGAIEEIRKKTAHKRNPKEHPLKHVACDDVNLKDGKVKSKEDDSLQSSGQHQISVKEEQEYPQTDCVSAKGITDKTVVTPSRESNAMKIGEEVDNCNKQGDKNCAQKGRQVDKNMIDHTMDNNPKRVRKLQFFELYEEIKSQLSNSDLSAEAKKILRHLKAWLVHKTQEPGFKASSFDAARLRCVMQYFEDTLEKLVNAEKKQDDDDICLYKFQLDTIIEDFKEEYSIIHPIASVPIKSEEDN